MKIGLLIYNSLDTISGGYLYDRQLVDFLRRQGDTVTVISLQDRGYLRNLSDNWRYGLLRWLQGYDFDLLLQDEMSHPSLLWLNRALRSALNCPIVSLVHLLRIHDGASRRSLSGRLEAAYLQRTDGLIVTSKTTRRAVEQLLGTLPPLLVATPGGDRLQPIVEDGVLQRRSQERRLRLLYVGNVIRRKALTTVLRGLAQFDNGELWIVGSLLAEPAYVGEVRGLIEQLTLYDRVHFLGPLDGAALADQYRRSHLLLMPSRYESFGIVYLEAMGFGVPSIASTVGAAVELIDDGENGFLIAPDAAQELGRRLQQLDDERQLLLTMSCQARRCYLAQPTWRQTMQRVRGFLQQTVAAWKVGAH